MYEIFDPISGEKGFFCTVQEKQIIDAVLFEQVFNQDSSRSNVRGVDV